MSEPIVATPSGEVEHALPRRNGIAWRYCGRCGNRMAWTRAGSAYNRETGVRGPTYAWACPNFTSRGTGEDRHDRSNAVVHDPQRERVEH